MTAAKIALVGNPNSGKTTLFNAITGANQRVGNWPGVTVEKKEAFARIGDRDAYLIDLPGVYSLEPFSVEERVTAGYLSREKPDVVLNVADATALSRSLFLSARVARSGVPMVVALNLSDDLAARGGGVDCETLTKELGVPVVAVSAKRRMGFDNLFDALYGQMTRPVRPHAFPRDDGQCRAAIDAMLNRAQYKSGGTGVTARIDRWALGGYTAWPIFLAMLALLFFITFGAPGQACRRAMERLVALAPTAWLDAPYVPAWVASLMREGVIAGVGGVAAFMPQILLLFLCLTLLEDSGYMARAAFLTDLPLRRAGLSGRSFIPMLMGFGCTTTAVMGARGVDNDRDRRMTVLLTPYMSCGAKLPVYALFAATFFPRRAGLAIAGLYALGVCAMACAAWLLRRTAFREGETGFVMELPPYRAPSPGSVLRRLGQRARDFLARAGTLIFAMSVIAWFLRHVSPDLRWADGAEDSLFYRLCRFISPVLAPIGLGDWRKCAALTTGLVAKEAIVSTLGVLYAGEALEACFTPPEACAFLVFTLLYAPCVSALAAMRRELRSAKLMAISLFMHTLFAYVAALIAYWAGKTLF